MVHQVNEDHCKKFNSQLMRAMINKKMRKNPTYVEFVQEKAPGTKLDFIKSPKDAAKIE
jgi:hypothetical protein